mmetsp:Transcript_31325/g.83015  ORF Transcript_31325/g.83015 Transcript_31325/m.83015 type:complete len:210 (-) Transcript_31325:195-824(-)
MLRARRPVDLARAAPLERDLDAVHDLIDPVRPRAMPGVPSLGVMPRDDAGIRAGGAEEAEEGEEEQQGGRQPEEGGRYVQLRRGLVFRVGPVVGLAAQRGQRREQEEADRADQQGACAHQHRRLRPGHKTSAAEEAVVSGPGLPPLHEPHVVAVVDRRRREASRGGFQLVREVEARQRHHRSRRASVDDRRRKERLVLSLQAAIQVYGR